MAHADLLDGTLARWNAAGANVNSNWCRFASLQAGWTQKKGGQKKKNNSDDADDEKARELFVVMNNVMGLVAQPLYHSVTAVVSDAKHTNIFSGCKVWQLGLYVWFFFCLLSSMHVMRREKMADRWKFVQRSRVYRLFLYGCFKIVTMYFKLNSIFLFSRKSFFNAV